MKLDRFRAPALAATAVLLISGAGIAFARAPAATSTQIASARVAPASQAEPNRPDTDTLQQGDQTTPDVVNGVQSAAKAAATKPAAKAPSETASESSEGSESTSAESDGPGGHADPAGQNVDHQFNGQE
jgi:hypothetical protein